MTDSQSKLDETGTFSTAQPASALSRILGSVMEAGLIILNRRRGGGARSTGEPEAIADQCRQLIDHRGEASGLALAGEILDAYQALPIKGRWYFFELLLRDFSTDADAVIRAAERYRIDPQFGQLKMLDRAIESPRHKLFRRLNQAPGGTSALITLRSDLLRRLSTRPELKPVDFDLKQLLIAWFNRGFLVLERVSWDSSARLLEKIIEYEAVHEINGWDDLRGRLREDRRLYAFFHPAMPNDPVIFIEIALNKGSAKAIEPLLNSERTLLDSAAADTATFYSISNCHRGLRGISFGNFLIKQVTESLRIDLNRLKRFETLSPIPGFRSWVQKAIDNGGPNELRDELKLMSESSEKEFPIEGNVADACRRLCAHYLLNEKHHGLPLDPVARFHLSNGAYLDRIHLAADPSETGKQRSFGAMVNYVYKLTDIENNHEAYFADGTITASGAVRKLA